MIDPAMESELRPLLAELLETELTGEQQLQLEQLLTESADARQFYREFVSVHTLLEWSLGETTLEGPTDTIAVPQEAESDTPERATESRISRALPTWSRPAYDFLIQPSMLGVLVSGLFMSILLLSLALIVPDWKRFLPGDDLETPSVEFVARITDAPKATFDETSDGNFMNRDLFEDDSLVLNAGLVVVEYDTGARVVLEGPATYQIQGANGGNLRLGKLVAVADTDQATGFTVATPYARVIDLGTEFGVEVDENGAVEVGVLSGEVDVVRNAIEGKPVQRVRLVAGQGASVESAGGGIAKFNDLDAAFVFAMRDRLKSIVPSPTANVDPELLAHWKFDGDTQDSVGSYHGTHHGDVDFATGRFGQAATFDGDGDFVATKTSPLPSTDFTLCAWVFANETASFNYVAGTQSSDNAGAFLRVNNGTAFVNLLPPADSRRASGGVVDQKEWTHLAMTVSSTDGLKVYVNGSQVASDQEGIGHLQVNNFTFGKRPDGDEYFFHGLLDEVAVYNAPLSDNQIVNVYRHGAEHHNHETSASETADR